MALKRKPRKGKTAMRWRGPEGKFFAELVEDIRYPSSGKVLSWKAVCNELEKMGYGVHKCPDKLKADYHDAVKYWTALYGGQIDEGTLGSGEVGWQPFEDWSEQRHNPKRKKE